MKRETMRGRCFGIVFFCALDSCNGWGSRGKELRLRCFEGLELHLIVGGEYVVICVVTCLVMACWLWVWLVMCFSALRSLSAAGRSTHAVGLEQRALLLSIEEGKVTAGECVLNC